MKRRRTLVPELDLPERVTALLSEYFGPRRLAKLTPYQRGRIARLATSVGADVSDILRQPDAVTAADGFTSAAETRS